MWKLIAEASAEAFSVQNVPKSWVCRGNCHQQEGKLCGREERNAEKQRRGDCREWIGHRSKNRDQELEIFRWLTLTLSLFLWNSEERQWKAKLGWLERNENRIRFSNPPIYTTCPHIIPQLFIYIYIYFGKLQKITLKVWRSSNIPLKPSTVKKNNGTDDLFWIFPWFFYFLFPSSSLLQSQLLRQPNLHKTLFSPSFLLFHLREPTSVKLFFAFFFFSFHLLILPYNQLG